MCICQIMRSFFPNFMKDVAKKLMGVFWLHLSSAKYDYSNRADPHLSPPGIILFSNEEFTLVMLILSQYNFYYFSNF